MRSVGEFATCGAILALGLVLNVPLRAQEPIAGTGRVSVDVSFNVASRYVFRGHEKDGRGFVLQPDLQVGYALRRARTGIIRDVKASGFAWGSAHTGHRAHSSGIGLYEADLGAAVTARLPGSWEATVLYTGYYAPTGAFFDVHEIALAVGRSAGAGPFAVSPRALLAREFSDAGGSEDTYLELGAELTVPATGAVSWRFPLAIGLSPDGFYTNSAGESELFGFFGAGVVGGADLADFGLTGAPGSLEAGVTATFLNPDAESSQDARNDVLWTIHVGLSFALER